MYSVQLHYFFTINVRGSEPTAESVTTLNYSVIIVSLSTRNIIFNVKFRKQHYASSLITPQFFHKVIFYLIVWLFKILFLSCFGDKHFITNFAITLSLIIIFFFLMAFSRSGCLFFLFFFLIQNCDQIRFLPYIGTIFFILI